jgi:hypothetical protein
MANDKNFAHVMAPSYAGALAERKTGKREESRKKHPKTLAKMHRWAFDSGMSKLRLIPVALVVISLLVGGCESLRPPAKDQAIWKQEQKQSDASAQKNGMEDLLYWIAYNTASVFVH